MSLTGVGEGVSELTINRIKARQQVRVQLLPP